MVQQQSLLVAVNQPSSLPDLTPVIALALATGSQINLVHAVPAREGSTAASLKPISEQFDDGQPPKDESLASAYEQLSAQADALAEQRIDAATHVLVGPPIDVILTVAEKLDSTLIVVVGRTHDINDRTVLGSLTSGLLKAADRPVLVLPAGPAQVRPGLSAAVDRLIELIDRQEETELLAELRAAATAELQQPTSDQDDRHPGEKLVDAIHKFETTHPTLTRAINDVSYYLSGLGL